MKKNWLIVFSIIISVGFSQRSIVQQFSETFADVAEKVNPAVVTISTNKIIKVETAEEMFNAVLDCLPTDIAIFSAAVSDFKIKNKEKYKIKKNKIMDLSLEKNIDILNHISKHNSLRPKMVIGFAAETNNLSEYAKKKLSEKNCDWIVANDVSDTTIGFGSDFNEVSIYYKNMKYEKLPKMKKSLLADNIVKKVISHLN